MSALISVLIVSGLAAALAALLVVAERYIANYGECTIDVNASERQFTVNGGSSLLEALTQQKIFIPSACGGRGTCAYCKCKVLDGAGPISPTEEPYLDADERKEGIRLSCQVKIRRDINVEIPEDLLSVIEFRATVESIEELTYDIKNLRLKLAEPDTIDFVPGQYIQLLTPKYKGNPEEIYRAYSVSSDPTEKGVLETIIRLVPGGICTTWVFKKLNSGDEIRLNGPYGEFHLTDNDRPIIFIAGGSGMSPIKCMLHDMSNTNNPREAVYFFGANTTRDLFMVDRMKQFEAELPNFRFVPVIARPAESPGWDGETGLVTEAVKRNVKNAAEAEAYLCGSPGMIDASIVVLKELGLTENRIFYDKFS